MVLLLAIGWLDYITGYELGLFTFYALPVGIVAWKLGRNPGILIAVAAGLVWMIADVAAGDKYSSRFFLYWNATLHFGAFLINAITIAKIKQTLDQRHQLEEELIRAREEIRRLKNQTDGDASAKEGAPRQSESDAKLTH
ncbi:MAG: hypothetical protein HY300_00035 [Verrucomicrobia bacterium]|nr:hypothetical protein [Verrucomicrobiota bacterium]